MMIKDQIKQRKDELRTEARRRRASIPGPARIRAADQLASHFNTLGIDPSQTIGCYWPIGTEMKTEPLLRRLQSDGYSISLPRTIGTNSALRFFEWRMGEPLIADALGFPTASGSEEVLPDILLVPLIAFDNCGNRLGHGAGFYDRTLNHLRLHNHSVRAIGIGFACQEFDNLPIDAHDQPLEGILTESGYIEANPANCAENSALDTPHYDEIASL